MFRVLRLRSDSISRAAQSGAFSLHILRVCFFVSIRHDYHLNVSATVSVIIIIGVIVYN